MNSSANNKIIHRADSRGLARHGWLTSRHTFSFAGYHNPDRMHFGVLRVLNDDMVTGGMGFGSHPHDNMEIISIPLSGVLEHRDSTGRHAVIRTNDVQIMSAGKGIMHSEYNHSPSEEVNFLQIWIFPKTRNITPRYEQKTFDPAARHNRFQLVVSPDSQQGSIRINQDAYLSLGDLEAGTELAYAPYKKGNGLYVFLLSGELEVEEEKLFTRDAMGLSEAEKISFKAIQPSQVLLLEVPMELQ